MSDGEVGFGMNQQVPLEPAPAGTHWVELGPGEWGDVGDWALYRADAQMARETARRVLVRMDSPIPIGPDESHDLTVQFRYAAIAYARAFDSGQRVDLYSRFVEGLSDQQRDAHTAVCWIRSKHVAHSTATLEQVQVLIAIPDDPSAEMPVLMKALALSHAYPQRGAIAALHELARRADEYFTAGMYEAMTRIAPGLKARLGDLDARPIVTRMRSIPEEQVKRPSRRARPVDEITDASPPSDAR